MISKGINQIREKGGKSFSILFAGDFCVRSEKSLELLKNGGAREIVRDIKPFFDSADIRVLQWEVVCGMEGSAIPKSGPNLHNPEYCIDFAKALGVDITLLANNHTGDFGAEMAMKTKERLEAAGFMTAGVGKELSDAAKPLCFEHAGLKISLLNFCENEFGTARVDTAGTNPYSVTNISRSIRAAKANSDLVLLAMHGGHEQNPLPSPRMTDEFRFYAESGADLVFNCHTHCPEGAEVVNGVPVIYSPGNFFFPKDELFGGNEEADRIWRTGYLTKFYCDENGVYAYELKPYRFTREGMTLLTGDAEDGFFKYLNAISAPLQDAGHLKRLFDGWSIGRGYKSYFNNIRNGLPELSAENMSSYLSIRNIFTCESHNDMIKNVLRIIEQGRVEEAAGYWEEVVKYMKMDF